VYLRRQGFRTWDVEQVPQLLEAQEAVLRDIENMVADSKRLLSTRPMDYTLRSVATGAATLLEQVAQARNHYRELSTILERELISRKLR
jgi:DNA-binding SARP family transcriptional activator